MGNPALGSKHSQFLPGYFGLMFTQKDSHLVDSQFLPGYFITDCFSGCVIGGCNSQFLPGYFLMAPNILFNLRINLSIPSWILHKAQLNMLMEALISSQFLPGYFRT